MSEIRIVENQLNRNSSEKPKKLEEILILKGVAIICMVVAHSVNAFNGIGWSSVIKGDYDPILAFFYFYPAIFIHLFFAISGYLYPFSFKRKMNIKAYARFISRKLQRLLVPLLFLTALNFILSGIFGSFNGGTPGGILGHLWYLIVLFIILAIFPFFELIFKKVTSFYLMVLILILMDTLYNILHIIPLGDNIFNSWIIYTLFALHYGGFFYFGYFCQKQQVFEKLKASANNNKILGILLSLLVVLIVLNQIINPATFNPISMILINIFTIFYWMVNICFYWILALKVQSTRIKMTTLKIIGKYSYSIYILHQPLILILIYYTLDIYLQNPYLLSPLFGGLGIILPYLLSKFIIKKNKVISYLFGETADT